MHGGFPRLSTCRPVPAIRHAVSTMYACRLHARCTSASPLPLDIFGQTDNTRQSGPKIDCPLAYPGLVKRQAWLLDGHGSALSPRMFHYLGRGKLEVLCRKIVSHVPQTPGLQATRCGRLLGTLARRGNQPPFARLVSPFPAFLTEKQRLPENSWFRKRRYCGCSQPTLPAYSSGWICRLVPAPLLAEDRPRTRKGLPSLLDLDPKPHTYVGRWVRMDRCRWNVAPCNGPSFSRRKLRSR